MLNDLFVSAAYAQDAAAPSPVSSLIPLIFIFVVFYFLLIRPQQKKYKQHQEMVSNIKRNDKIVTAGGIHGKVSKVEDGGVLLVTIADGVDVKIQQDTVSNVLTRSGEDKEKSGDSQSAKGKKPKAANDNA